MSSREPETRVSLRLALFHQEIARLPDACRGVSVRKGLAWLTVHGQDWVLRAGDTVTFEPGQFPAVVTALGPSPLILETFGGERRRAASITIVRPSRRPCSAEADRRACRPA